MEVEAEESKGAKRQDGAAFGLMQLIFQYGHSATDAAGKEALKQSILSTLEQQNMAHIYEEVCAKYGWPVDAALLERMRAAVAAESSKYDASIAEAKEKFGDVELFERTRDKADYLAQRGDKAGAFAAYDAIDPKTLSTGQKIDIVMCKARLALLHSEWAEAKKLVEQAKELNEKGGDWDRRNRLKVYEALEAVAHRDLTRASALLVDSIATFTATEVLDYTAFVFYTAVVALKTLDRPALKKEVIDSPDVLSVIGQLPDVQELLHSFYEGRYKDFQRALLAVHKQLVSDRFMAAHAAYYLREMRLAAYTQFLASYKSVTLASMAATFGVSVQFLDEELSRFIASGRISALIDAVSGIVETTRPDSKAAQYQAVLKQGDQLLNRIQKLSRAVAA